MCLNMHSGLQIVRVKKKKKPRESSVKANIAKLQKEQDTHTNAHSYTRSHLAVFISSEACCVNYMVLERELEYTQHF